LANTPINAKEFFKLNDEHHAKIVTLDKDARKMSLSIKQAQLKIHGAQLKQNSSGEQA